MFMYSQPLYKSVPNLSSLGMVENRRAAQQCHFWLSLFKLTSDASKKDRCF